MSLQQRLSTPVHVGPRRLCHANLFVSDLERSLTFYNRVCGFEIVMRQPPIKAGFLSNGNTHHDVGLIEVTKEAVFGADGHKILGPGQGAKPGLNHFGWEMESEFDLTKAYERAVAADYQIHRTVRHRSSHSIYLFDPDGNAHEFYADVDKDWRGLYAGKDTISGEWRPGEKAPTMDRRYHDNPEIRRDDSALIHPNRITHAVIVARDFDVMRAFFVNVAGLLEVYSREGIAVFGAHASNYPAALVLLKSADQSVRKQVHHISFEVSDEADLIRSEAAIRAAGIAIDQVVDRSHKRSFVIKDPDGLPLEFYVSRLPNIPWDLLPTESFASAA